MTTIVIRNISIKCTMQKYIAHESERLHKTLFINKPIRKPPVTSATKVKRYLM